MTPVGLGYNIKYVSHVDTITILWVYIVLIITVRDAGYNNIQLL